LLCRFQRNSFGALDCVNVVAIDTPNFVLSGNEGQIIAVQESNKSDYTIGFDNSLEPSFFDGGARMLVACP